MDRKEKVSPARVGKETSSTCELPDARPTVLLVVPKSIPIAGTCACVCRILFIISHLGATLARDDTIRQSRVPASPHAGRIPIQA